MLSPVQSIEFFHLSFLRMMEARVDRSTYVVKGGVNLRAWFGSLRYSEDLDIDAIAGTPHELREKVDAILAGAPFGGLLRTQALRMARISKPKQTEVTQRWKVELAADSLALPVHTKIEFSRRGSNDASALEPVRREVVSPYQMAAPTANHYTASAAASQKLRALAGRREPQARDIWDLEHLFRTADVQLLPLSDALRETLPRAFDRLTEVSFDEFRAQVVPYLDPDHQELYETKAAWTGIVELVGSRLLELESGT